ASPVSRVAFSASRFIHASVSTRFVPASCAITGTKPSDDQLTLLSQASAMSGAHFDAGGLQLRLRFADGELAVMEDRRGEHRIGAATDDAVDQVLQRADAARCDHRDADRIGHRAREPDVEADL